MSELYRRIVVSSPDFEGETGREGDHTCHYEYVRDEGAERLATFGLAVWEAAQKMREWSEKYEAWANGKVSVSRVFGCWRDGVVDADERFMAAFVKALKKMEKP